MYECMVQFIPKIKVYMKRAKNVNHIVFKPIMNGILHANAKSFPKWKKKLTAHCMNE